MADADAFAAALTAAASAALRDGLAPVDLLGVLLGAAAGVVRGMPAELRPALARAALDSLARELDAAPAAPAGALY